MGNRVFLTNQANRLGSWFPWPKTDQQPHRGLGMYKDVKLPRGFGSRKQRRAATQAVLDDMGL